MLANLHAHRHYSRTQLDRRPTSRRHLIHAPARELADGSWPLQPIRTTRIELSSDPAAARTARDAVDMHLGGALGDPALRDLRLLVSEVVNNAVLHGPPGEPIVLYLAMAAERVRVEVCDAGSGFDAIAPMPPPGAGGGFGLSLVDNLAARWGVAGEGCGCVWFEIDR